MRSRPEFEKEFSGEWFKKGRQIQKQSLKAFFKAGRTPEITHLQDAKQLHS